MDERIRDLTRVRFDELAVFVEVAAAGSIAAASRRLAMPKSTVGRAITRIEQDLGVPLVRRMTRGPTLTESGRILAQLAAPHVNALRDLSSALGRQASEAYGTLRVTAPPDVGTLIIAPLLSTFAVRHPRVRVEVDLSMRITDLVREGFDCAIRLSQRRTMPSSALIAKRLARLDLGLYAGTAYLTRHDTPKRAEDLAHHDYVLFNSQNGKDVLQLEGPKGPVKVSVSGRTSANDFYFVREAIASGAGIGGLPWFVAQPEVAAGRLVRVLSDHRLGSVTAYLVYAPADTLAPKLVAFRALLLERAAPLLMHP